MKLNGSFRCEQSSPLNFLSGPTSADSTNDLLHNDSRLQYKTRRTFVRPRGSVSLAS